MSTSDEKIARGRVLVIGVGGLGAPAATALAAAGVGTLGLVDPDAVELSNLHRQPLYASADVGRAKVEVAAERLGALAPALRVETWHARFGPPDAHLLRRFDVVLAGTDTIAAKPVRNGAPILAAEPLAIDTQAGSWRPVPLAPSPRCPVCAPRAVERSHAP